MFSWEHSRNHAWLKLCYSTYPIIIFCYLLSITILDVFKICKKRCIKYNSKFTNFIQIKYALFAEMAFNKLFIMKQSTIIHKLQARFIRRLIARILWHECTVSTA